jgi:predicted nuclease with RNAse H fold
MTAASLKAAGLTCSELPNKLPVKRVPGVWRTSQSTPPSAYNRAEKVEEDGMADGATPAAAVVGIDLAGPSNVADTAMVWFQPGTGRLVFAGSRTHATDATILRTVEELAGATGDIVVGLDAPLSYNPGGGDRTPDQALRARLVGLGLPAGTVMSPTMTRMAYLTLRGVVVARTLERALPGRVRIVETHPLAAMALRGAPVASLQAAKRSSQARAALVAWLATAGLGGLSALIDPSDHLIAACACALAAAGWAAGAPAWIAPAMPPQHPYDFAA